MSLQAMGLILGTVQNSLIAFVVAQYKDQR